MKWNLGRKDDEHHHRDGHQADDLAAQVLVDPGGRNFRNVLDESIGSSMADPAVVAQKQSKAIRKKPDAILVTGFLSATGSELFIHCGPFVSKRNTHTNAT